jgi:hypothetical protein
MHQEVSYSSETVGPGRPRAKGRCGKQVLFPGGNRGTGRGRGRVKDGPGPGWT